MAVTQKEIAQNLGVSRELVKFALGGKGRVGAASRERILAEAARVGYSKNSNSAARALAAKRNGQRVHSDIIALAMGRPLVEDMPLAATPYFREITRGIEDAVSRLELDLFLCTFNASHAPHLISDGGVDGVLVLGSTSPEIETLPLPIVTFEPSDGRFHGVSPDGRSGSFQATQHLLDLGHKNIAHLSFTQPPKPPSMAAAHRLTGYLDALEKSGLAPDEALIVRSIRSPGQEEGALGMRRLINSGTSFSGVVCFNDLIAIGAIQELQRHGYRVPQDVSVVGFDDVAADYNFQIPLTTISFDRFAMGKRAVELTCQVRDGSPDQAALPIDESFPTTLVVRRSTAPCQHNRLSLKTIS